MKRGHSFELPERLKPDMRKARRLEWITLGYLCSVIGIMYLVMGNSQAMKTAWLEDALSILPSIAFLIASKIYNRAPTPKFPYGYHRVFSIAFLTGSLALFAMGTFLIIDSASSLIKAEHPTIGQVEIAGHSLWLGWVMIGALVYSSVPAVFIGYKKKPLAHKLHNKILLTDAAAQKADYMTAFAAIAGVLLVGFGWWWADAVAALFIAVSVVKDGFQNLKAAILDLMDRKPLNTDDQHEHPLMEVMRRELKSWTWIKDYELRFREEGQVLFGEVLVVPQEETINVNRMEQAMEKLKALDWKIFDVHVVPVAEIEKPG